MITNTAVFKEGTKYEIILAEALGISVKSICSNNAYDILSQLNNTFEVKTEISMWEKTNNHFCEFKQQIKGKWIPSGIDVSQSYFWCVVLLDYNKIIKDIVVVVKEDLKNLIKEKNYSTRRISSNRIDTLTEGYLVNIDDLKKLRTIITKEADMIKLYTNTITGIVSDLETGTNPNGGEYTKFFLKTLEGGFEVVVKCKCSLEEGTPLGVIGKFKDTKSKTIFVSDCSTFIPL